MDAMCSQCQKAYPVNFENSDIAFGQCPHCFGIPRHQEESASKGRGEIHMGEEFRAELEHLLNRHSLENASNTPDFILAQYLCACLAAWDQAVQQRETWYGRDARPSLGSLPLPSAGTRVTPE